jgi:hypothetical protein
MVPDFSHHYNITLCPDNVSTLFFKFNLSLNDKPEAKVMLVRNSVLSTTQENDRNEIWGGLHIFFANH